VDGVTILTIKETVLMQNVLQLCLLSNGSLIGIHKPSTSSDLYLTFLGLK